MSEQSVGKRIAYIDFLKAFAIATVLLGHSVEQLSGDAFWDHPIWSFLYSFHMPLFMFVSGLFFKSSLRKGFGEVLRVMLDEDPQKRPLNLTELPDRIAPVAQPETAPSKRFGAKCKVLVAAVVVIALGVGCWLYWGQFGTKTIRTDDLLAIPAAVPEG